MTASTRTLAFTLALMLLTAGASAGDRRVVFVMPLNLAAAAQPALERFSESLRGRLGSDFTVEWSVAETQGQSVTQFAVSAAAHQRGQVFLVGVSAAAAARIYESLGDQARPRWLASSGQPMADRDMSDGVIALGAGWRTARSGRGTVLSVPHRKGASLPIVSLQAIGSGDGSDRAARSVADAVYGTREGIALMRALTMIPNGPQPPSNAFASPAEFGLVEVKIRPEADEDGDDCDCDDDSELKSCDPDGYVIGSTDGLAVEGNRVLLPTAAVSQSDDDDDDCDECEDQALSDLEVYISSPRFQDQRRRQEFTFGTSAFDDHVESLFLARAQGKSVLVLTCDPD